MIGFAVAVEVADAGGIEPAMRAAERRRLGDDLVFAFAQADHRQAGAALERGLHHDDLVVAVAVEIGEPRLEILEHGIVFEPHGLAFAVARFDHQGAGCDLVAENAVVVTRGRLGEPGAGDVAGADGDVAVGQGAVRRFRLCRFVDEGERDALAREHDLVPKAAGIDLGLPVGGLDRRHARRRIDVAHAPFGGVGGGGANHEADSEKHAMHRRVYNAARRSRKALPTTLTDDSAIAAAAMIGDSSSPNTG